MKNPLCAIDIGTVSTRLIVASIDSRGRIAPLERQARITDLGEGVDATDRLSQAAITRTLEMVDVYLANIRAHAGQAGYPLPVTVTTTSAARDAANAAELTEALEARGLAPQVIPGNVEASLALLGVTSDFIGTPLLVADVGGGSTELTAGERLADGTLAIQRCDSYNLGCRRLAERFGLQDAASPQQVVAARAQASEVLAAALSNKAHAPGRLVCVGGTATSLVSIACSLVPYDSSFVHLHELQHTQVAELAQRLCTMPLAERREMPGLQAKRASVIGAGALIIDALLELGGWQAYTASESDSLFGLIACMQAALTGAAPPLDWTPRTAFIA